MVETDFYTALSSPAAITALCASRIYPLLLPTEVVLPAIDYSFVGGSSASTFDTTGTQKYRVEVNCWGETYADSVTLRAAVVAALNCYVNGKTSIQFLQPTDFFDHELMQYRAMAEFYIFTSF
jgi:hypothetical protein